MRKKTPSMPTKSRQNSGRRMASMSEKMAKQIKTIIRATLGALYSRVATISIKCISSEEKIIMDGRGWIWMNGHQLNVN